MEKAGADLQRNVSPNTGELRSISARAIIYCPECGYKRSFKNKFQRENMELIIVSFKILDWMSCEQCGTMLNLALEYEI